MTLLGGLGCFLISLGPCVVLFIFTVARNPLKVIVLTASSFFWLMSLLITALSWLVFKHFTHTLAPSLVCGVISQEALRFAFYKLIMMADDGLQVISNNSNSLAARHRHSSDSSASSLRHTTDPYSTSMDPCISNSTAASGGERPPPLAVDDYEESGKRVIGETKRFDHRIVAYVAGLGFGLMTGIFESMHNLIDSFGPGIGVQFWDAKAFFIIAAFETMCLSVMQIFWSVILFVSFEQRCYGVIVATYLSHFLVSCSSLMNQLNFPWPEIICSFYLVTLIVLGFCTPKLLGIGFHLSRRNTAALHTG